MNSARWSMVNKQPLGLSSNRYGNDSSEGYEELNKSTDSMPRINLLSKNDVSILIDQYVPTLAGKE
jgi:hypothetical protein